MPGYTVFINKNVFIDIESVKKTVKKGETKV